jgi:hypothetical protein
VLEEKKIKKDVTLEKEVYVKSIPLDEADYYDDAVFDKIGYSRIFIAGSFLHESNSRFIKLILFFLDPNPTEPDISNLYIAEFNTRKNITTSVIQEESLTTEICKGIEIDEVNEQGKHPP